MTVTTTATMATEVDLTEVPRYHTAGIGAGPANLSLAALFQAVSDEGIALFDGASSSRWHVSLLHNGVRMQTSWLKDLVSVVDPTHQLSFLNYLVSEGRLFALINSQFDALPRREYMNYLAWAADRLDNIHFNSHIDEIGYLEDTGFLLFSGGHPIASSANIVIGVGTRPSIPVGLAGLPAERSFLADDVAQRLPTLTADLDQPIAVVGSGQTGIEAVVRLTNAGFTDIRWVGRQQWFRSIDDSPAGNEFYRPAHQAYLQTLPRAIRHRLIDEHEHTGDAITPGGLRGLYQLNYDRMLELGRFPVTLLPGRNVVGGRATDDQIILDCTTDDGTEGLTVSQVVIAVGRQLNPVPFSAELRERIELDEDDHMIIGEDYSVAWRGDAAHRIYALNRARFSHGIPDANLTLLPVRAATVLNSMFDKEFYTISDQLCPVAWR